MNNDLRNLKPTQSETVAVAMSGGVDSAVALFLAKQTAKKVFGVTAIMTREESRCCSREEVEGAQAVAASLGVDHHIIELQDTFQKEVIDYFSSEYLSGRTPSPCVKCNRYIKFGELWEKARGLGADRIATGHYARVCDAGSSVDLLRGVDSGKDQSYFLAMLTQDQIANACFPVGHLTKQDVRAICQKEGLPVRSRQESQEVCFITEGTHGNWIDVRTLGTGGPGNIVDRSGRKLGRHAGIHHYTVGQRRGLGVAAGERMFVVHIDREKNEVVLGPREEAMSEAMRVEQMSWLHDPPHGELKCETQIRYAQDAAECRVIMDAAGEAQVVFAEAQFGVAPGQLAAFYDGDKVLGGGWIAGRRMKSEG